MFGLNIILVTLVCYFLHRAVKVNGISCKDENNQDVDWFLIYKLPKIDSEPKGSHLYNGKAYAYITSDGSKEWTMSSKAIDEQDSILGRTWHGFDEQKKVSGTASLFYNDNAPDPYTKTAIGHIKGYFAFDMETGFWLEHSVPNFGQIDKYKYPDTGFLYGQSGLCITTSTSSLNEICHHLLFCTPNIYEKEIADSIKDMLEGDAQSLFSAKPKFVSSPPFKRQSTLTSLGNQIFHTFAKDNQLNIDIYSEILAPALKTSLDAETWRQGSGGILPPACESEFSVLDVKDVKMGDVSFSYLQDHSKWAIAQDGTDPWVCIGDLNRMASQGKRGGGALCFQQADVRSSYKALITETDHCPA